MKYFLMGMFISLHYLQIEAEREWDCMNYLMIHPSCERGNLRGTVSVLLGMNMMYHMIT